MSIYQELYEPLRLDIFQQIHTHINDVNKAPFIVIKDTLAQEHYRLNKKDAAILSCFDEQSSLSAILDQCKVLGIVTNVNYVHKLFSHAYKLGLLEISSRVFLKQETRDALVSVIIKKIGKSNRLWKQEFMQGYHELHDADFTPLADLSGDNFIQAVAGILSSHCSADIREDAAFKERLINLVRIAARDQLYWNINKHKRRWWRHILYFSLPLVRNADALISRMLPIARLLFNYPVFILATGIFFISIFDGRFWQLLWYPVPGSQIAWFALYPILVGLISLHELGHALACKKYGVAIGEIGIVFICLQGYFYTNVSDSYMLPRKRDRLLIDIGGVYMDYLILTAFLAVSHFQQISAVSSIVVKIIVISIMLNLNPLLKFDGYFILSDALGIPNLRSRSFSSLCRLLFPWRTDMEVEQSITSWQKILYLAYSLISTIFILLILGYMLLRFIRWLR